MKAIRGSLTRSNGVRSSRDVRVRVNHVDRPNRSSEAFRQGLASACAAACIMLAPEAAMASVPPGKIEVSGQELLSIIKDDFVSRKYLTSGNLTKEVYADDAHFADGNDDFGNGLDSWVNGVKVLFVSDKCKLALTDDVVLDEQARTITFEGWRQVSAFRLPGVPHTMIYTGHTVLTLDPVENIVVDHTEYWDQKPSDLLQSFKFFDPNFDPPGFD